MPPTRGPDAIAPTMWVLLAILASGCSEPTRPMGASDAGPREAASAPAQLILAPHEPPPRRWEIRPNQDYAVAAPSSDRVQEVLLEVPVKLVGIHATYPATTYTPTTQFLWAIVPEAIAVAGANCTTLDRDIMSFGYHTPSSFMSEIPAGPYRLWIATNTPFNLTFGWGDSAASAVPLEPATTSRAATFARPDAWAPGSGGSVQESFELALPPMGPSLASLVIEASAALAVGADTHMETSVGPADGPPCLSGGETKPASLVVIGGNVDAPSARVLGTWSGGADQWWRGSFDLGTGVPSTRDTWAVMLELPTPTPDQALGS